MFRFTIRNVLLTAVPIAVAFGFALLAASSGGLAVIAIAVVLALGGFAIMIHWREPPPTDNHSDQPRN